VQRAQDHIDVSIVIVNWNSRAFLEQCLLSVQGSMRNVAFEIIVVDNASYDGSREMVERLFPTVRYIQGEDNAGFARANNAASKFATGRQLLFLNPDTEVTPGAIERMVRFVDATPSAGAVGCRLLNTDGSLQTSCVQAFPTIVNQVLDSERLRDLFPSSRLWGTAALRDGGTRPAEVQAVSGACLLVRREVFNAVGAFTEAYFMYAEDIDLCFKLQRAGKTNHYLGDVEVVHHGGKSTNSSSESQFGNVMLRESIATYFALHSGSSYAVMYRACLGAAAVVRLVVIKLATLAGGRTARRDATQAASRKWTTILRWTVGAERWVRKHRAGVH
jgi:GT2 family glycosyltransferase